MLPLPQLFEHLPAVLATGDATAAAAAAELLRSATHPGDAGTTLRILQLLREPDARVRAGACLVLRAASSKQGQGLALRQATVELKNPEPAVRVAASRAVCLLVHQGGDAVLERALDSLQAAVAAESDATARWACLQAKRLLVEHRGSPPTRDAA